MSFVGPYPNGTAGAPETEATLADTAGDTVVRGYGPGYQLWLTTNGPFVERSILQTVSRVRTIASDSPSTSSVEPEPFADLGQAFANIISPGDPRVSTMSMTADIADTVVCSIGADDSSRSCVVSDSQGNTWQIVSESGSNGFIAVAYSTLTAALISGVDAITFDWNGSTDCVIHGRVFSGLQASSLGSATKAYSTGTTYSHSVSASAAGVCFISFEWPFDFSPSSPISGWVNHSVEDNTPDQSIHTYYRQVNSGVNTASKTLAVSIGYMASGVVLDYA